MNSSSESSYVMEDYLRKISEMSKAWAATSGPYIIDSFDGIPTYSHKETNRKLIYRRDKLNREIEHYRKLIE